MSTIYIGCRPVDTSYLVLEEFARDEIDEFAKKEKLPHYTCDPYNKGPRIVAAYVWTNIGNGSKPIPEHLVVDPLSPLGSAFIALLHENRLGHNMVMNGIR